MLRSGVAPNKHVQGADSTNFNLASCRILIVIDPANRGRYTALELNG